jgi:putative hemolysin
LTDKQATPEVTQRPDGSWLIDGKLPIDEFKEIVEIEKLPDEERYQTVGGLVMASLGRIPVAGDSVEVRGLRLEVVDMDERRVDKVLVVPASK